MKILITLGLLFSLGLARADTPDTPTIRMTVDGLVCAFCAQGIDKSLRALPQTADVFVSLERRLVAVAPHTGQDLEDAVLEKALKDAGYTLRGIERVGQSLADIRAERP